MGKRNDFTFYKKKKNVWTVPIHMKRYLTLLVTREMVVVSLGDIATLLSTELK